MRLARPVYESLPVVYMVIGAAALLVSYLDSPGIGGKVAFVIGVFAEIAGLTLFLRRQDYRALNREYSGQTIEL
jgi:hypothetical protein